MYEVYIRQYPEGGRRIQISTDGGMCPVWDPNGSELFYSDGVKMMAVAVTPDPDFSVGKAQSLFEVDPFATGGNFGPGYDGSGDSRRFVTHKQSELPEAQLTVVQNWFEELKRLVPSGKSQ